MILCVEQIISECSESQLLNSVLSASNVIQIINQAIGAFLGFVFALLSAWLMSYFGKKRKIHNLRKRVYLELADVYSNIMEKDSDKTLFYYELPIWESVISSARLLDIGDDDFLRPLVEIYERLKILKELEAKLLSENEAENPNSNIINKRKNLANVMKSSKLHFDQIHKIVDKLNNKNNT